MAELRYYLDEMIAKILMVIDKKNTRHNGNALCNKLFQEIKSLSSHS
ncbi:hypothetical protein dsat_1308 [Alkalidesulfovibrio alkalitolerans DSM 16529]|uniref:Uncharacterized protein n=1 Tax=Alkalidesulfovibrio alkalitolerans DSM 16529 TaxID=1121439 RepID=S7T1Y1_9BACT|nr:hypothetical protein dsat_1308 [Alkalidesulfovibrio alkalitolerans DSM 16529]